MDHIKVELDLIPVEERLPRDGIERNHRVVRYLVCLNKYPYYAIALRDNGQFYTLHGAHLESGITHWAEIPKIGE